MKKTSVSCIILGCLLVTGCIAQKSDVDELKNQIADLRQSLGDYQYLALNPMLEISVIDFKFKPPKDSYSGIQLSFNSSVKQTNPHFLPQDYRVDIEFSILNDNNNEVGSIHLSSQVKNGVLALAEDKEVYGVKAIDISGFKVVPKQYYWYPLDLHKPI